MTCASGELSRGVPRPRAVTSIGGHEHLGGRKEAISALRWRHEKSQHLSLARSGFFFLASVSCQEPIAGRELLVTYDAHARHDRMLLMSTELSWAAGWMRGWVDGRID